MLASSELSEAKLFASTPTSFIPQSGPMKSSELFDLSIRWPS